MKLTGLILASLCLAGGLAAKEYRFKTENLDRTFRKRPPVPPGPAKPAPAAIPAAGHWFAAFSTTLGDKLYADLENAGVGIIGLSHREEGFYVYRLKVAGRQSRAMALLQADPAFIEALSEQPEDKLSPRILRAEGLEYVNREGEFLAAVELHEKMDRARLEKAIPGLDIREFSRGNPKVVHVQCDAQQARLLAAHEAVRSVHPVEPFQPVNVDARALTGVDAVQNGLVTIVDPPTTGWLSGVRNTGDGIWIGINEGIDPNHRDFMERTPAGGNQLRRQNPADNFSGSDHGTHVASTAAGNGWNTHTSFFYAGRSGLHFRGMAPKALLSEYGDRGDANNHSFTEGGSVGYYAPSSADYDQRTTDHRVSTVNLDINNVMVMAAANNGVNAQYGVQRGYYSMLMNSKNSIKVGSVIKSANPVKSDFSSMGPTRDGRIGPDVMAPGGDESSDYDISFDEVAILAADNSVKHQWQFTAENAPEWGTPAGAEAYFITGLAQTGGRLRFTTIRRSGIASGTIPLAQRPTSARTDRLRIRYRATPRLPYTAAEAHLMFYWRVQGGAYWKGNPDFSRVDHIPLPADGTDREVVVDLNSPTLTRLNGGWVDGDIIEAIRFDFNPRGLTGARRNTQDYVSQIGTSMAAPVVTGIAALMLQKYRNDIMSVRCNTCNIHDHPMWNSSAKAVLIHTARDMVDESGNGPGELNPDFVSSGFNQHHVYGPGPDFATGYGMVDAVRALAYVDRARFLEDFVNAGQDKNYTFTVPSGAASMRVTLAWDDPPAAGPNDASTAYNNKLVNDLDLTLVELNTGRVFRPWVLDHNLLNNGTIPANGLDPITPDEIRNNPARPGKDSRNTVEVVDVAAPPAGEYAMVVRGFSVAVDQRSATTGINQDFSLVYDFEATPVASVYLPRGAGQQVIAAANQNTFLLRADGGVHTWGLNTFGALGRGTFPSSPTPARTTGSMPGIRAVSSLNCHSAALARDGRLYSWGCNLGRLGDNTDTHRDSPVEVCAMTGQACSGNRYVAVAAGGDFTVAIRADGSLWTWGENSFGQLGAPGAARKLPAQVGTNRDWAMVSAGGGHVLALRTDGSLWAWGQNNLFQCGISNGGAHVTSPTRVGASTWRNIAAGWEHSLAIRTSGQLYGWGASASYQVRPQGGNVQTPTLIGTATDWKDIATGGCYSLGLRNDGTLLGWGCNSDATLGRGLTSGPQSGHVTPCNATGQPCSGNKYLAVSAGVEGAIAIRTDGSVWTWGRNSTGSVGDGTTNMRMYPTRIGISPNTLSATRGDLTTAGTRDLTAEGSRDWAHWGHTAASTFDRKAGVANKIPNYTAIGAFTAGRYSGGLTTYRWTDGLSPNRNITASKTGVSTTVAASGFQVLVPAVSTQQTIRLYVGVNNATGRLEASLSDGSVPAYVNTSLTHTSARDGWYDVTFSSASSNANLVLKWTKSAGSGNASLQSVVLK